MAATMDTGIKVLQDHLFRHARELEKGAKGRYLEGWIKLPTNQDCLLQISTIPFKESPLNFHPNLIHITEMTHNSPRRVQWKSTLTPQCWRIQLVAENGVIHLLDPGTGQVLRHNICQIQDGKIILGGSGLLLTLIIPLKGDRGDPEGVRIADVLKERWLHQYQEPHQDPKCLVSDFTDRTKNPDALLEPHRCRLRVDFWDKQFQSQIAPSVVSDDIFNTKHNDVGSLDLQDCSDPRACCTLGRFKVLLSSEFKVPSHKVNQEPPCKPVFVVERHDGMWPVQELYPKFNQINEFQVHLSSLSFIVPTQNAADIAEMQSRQDILKVALVRRLDQRYSPTKFEFKYVPHVDQCHFCAIKCGSQLPAKVLARPNRKKRRLGEKIRRGSTSDYETNRSSLSPVSTYAGSLSSSNDEVTQNLFPDSILDDTISPPLHQDETGQQEDMIVPSSCLPDLSGDLTLDQILGIDNSSTQPLTFDFEAMDMDPEHCFPDCGRIGNTGGLGEIAWPDSTTGDFEGQDGQEHDSIKEAPVSERTIPAWIRFLGVGIGFVFIYEAWNWLF